MDDIEDDFGNDELRTPADSLEGMTDKNSELEEALRKYRVCLLPAYLAGD